MRLADRTAIVTGAGAGFGEGIAKRFAAEGARIVINDIDEQGGRRVADEIAASGGQATFHKADVSANAEMRGLVEAAERAFGGLDVIVNNEGNAHRGQR